MRFILASNNKGKVREIKDLFGKDHEVLSLADVGFFDEIEETGSTFVENAFIKLHAVCHRFPEFAVIADDSGLCVDALDGAPGVYSARYAGTHGDDEENIRKLLTELSVKNDRSARFVCAAAAKLPGGEEFFVLGECNGIITDEKRGSGGFGYDPVFFVPELGKTMAELTEEEKNEISHRGKAFRALAERIGGRVK